MNDILKLVQVDIVDVVAEEPKHHPLGASSADRWWNCPGSVDMIQRCGDKDTANKYSAEGTVAHSVAERKLKQLLGIERYTDNCHEGQFWQQDGFNIRVSREMLDAVEYYTGYVRELMETDNIKPHQIKLEQRIKVPCPDSLYGDIYSTADLTAFIPYQRLEVVDYKHGKGIKREAQDDKQLLIYGLGGLFSLDEYDRDEIPEVKTVICQPRNGGITTSIIDKKYLLGEFYPELLERVNAVRPGADLKAGDWCKWCPAKAQCPALTKKVSEIACLDFEDVRLPATMKSPTLPDPLRMNAQDIGELLKYKKMFAEWWKAIAARGLALAEAGEVPTGHKLVAKKSNRVFISQYEAENILYEDLGNEIYTEPTMKSLTELEKLFKAQAKGNAEGLYNHLTPKEAKAATKAYLETQMARFAELWEKPNTGNTLAVETDSRPEVRTSVVDDFVDVTSSEYTDNEEL